MKPEEKLETVLRELDREYNANFTEEVKPVILEICKMQDNCDLALEQSKKLIEKNIEVNKKPVEILEMVKQVKEKNIGEEEALEQFEEYEPKHIAVALNKVFLGLKNKSDAKKMPETRLMFNYLSKKLGETELVRWVNLELARIMEKE